MMRSANPNMADVRLGGCSGSCLVLWLLGDLGEIEESADLDVLLGRVAHVAVLVDAVAVAASVALALDVSGLDEVGEDALCSALRDADLFGDFAEPGVRCAGDAEEHLGVVGEEAPGALVRA